MQRVIFNIRLVAKIALRYVLVWAADTASIAITALVIPGVYFQQTGAYWYLTPFTVALGFGLLNALIRPILILLLLPITAMTFGLATLALNAGLFYMMNFLIPTFVVEGFLSAVGGVLFLTVVNTAIGSLIHLGDDYSFYATLMTKFSAMTGPRKTKPGDSGVLILQIDGLSYNTLRHAIRRGNVPFLSDMLKRRRFVARKWYSGLPAQTPAVQTALLYGNSYDIPGFRWYNKATGRLVVASNAQDMSAVDDRMAKTCIPLLRRGTVISGIVHGSAAKRMLTLSALGEKDIKQHFSSLEDFAIFSLHPYLYTRTMLFMAWEFIVDRATNLFGILRRKSPRITRSLKQSILRATANTFFRESSTFIIREDLVRGIPVIYANYLGYDMVAHYGGPRSWDALSALTGIDRQVKKIARFIAKHITKHYELVILSDHGQSECVPFRHLYGLSLTKFIHETLKTEHVEPGDDTAELGYLNTLLREMRAVESAYGTKPIRRSRRTLERLHARIQEDVLETPKAKGVVVCPSGNLAHVYFPEIPGRATTEWLMENNKSFIEALVSHPGIGFVITTNADNEVLMMGKAGMRRLRSGGVEGTDPLEPYVDGLDRETVIRSLVQLADYPNSGDVILNGALISRGKVVSFENQIGTHGGIGGEQTDPFVIFPSRYRRRLPMRNPTDMYGFLTALSAGFPDSADAPSTAGQPAD